MKSIPSLAFITGWGFDASIAQDFLPAGAQLINLPPLKNVPLLLDTLCLKLEDNIQGKETILIGWSLGGLLAIKLYHRQPNRYKALILIASTPCFWSQDDWLGISTEHQAIFQKNLSRGYRVFSAYYLKLISTPFPALKGDPRLYSHLLQNDDFKSYQQILFQADLRSEFSKIQIPTLILQGAKDPIVPLDLAPSLLKLNPDLIYETLPAAGHIPFMTHPSECQKKMSNFLKGLS